MCDETYGEKLVSINYDYTKDDDVAEIKSLYASIIDKLKSSRFEKDTNVTIESHSERQRYISIAITEAQTACMWAVKAVTAK